MHCFAIWLSSELADQVGGPDGHDTRVVHDDFEAIPEVEFGLEPTRGRNIVGIQWLTCPALGDTHLCVGDVRFAFRCFSLVDVLARELLVTFRCQIVLGIGNEVGEFVVDKNWSFHVFIQIDFGLTGCLKSQHLLAAKLIAIVDHFDFLVSRQREEVDTYCEG